MSGAQGSRARTFPEGQVLVKKEKASTDPLPTLWISRHPPFFSLLRAISKSTGLFEEVIRKYLTLSTWSQDKLC